jgi:hypothetical protein
VSNKNNYLGTPIGTIGTDLDSGLPITPIAPGYPTTYDAAKSPVPNPWGYNPDGTGRVSQIANLALQCFVQAPCGGSNRWIYQSQAAGEPTGQNPQQPPTQTDTTVYNYPNLPSYSPGSLPDLQSTANQTAMFTHAAGETILTLDPLRVPLPIAGDPTQYDGASDTCVLITLGWPQARITFHVEAERVGQWPAVPEPVPSFTMKGITGNLISAVLTPMPPTTDATSTSKILHVSARITYALNRPPARTDTIPLGVLQWTEYTPSQNALQLLSIYDAGVQPFSGGKSPSPGPGVKY